jgi:hypothetical protein
LRLSYEHRPGRRDQGTIIGNIIPAEGSQLILPVLGNAVLA